MKKIALPSIVENDRLDTDDGREMNLKSILKNVPAPSLGIKLTLYFVLFGLLIGYLSYVFFIFGSTRHNVQMAYDTIMPVVREMTGSRGEDFITELIDRKNSDLLRLIRIIEHSTSPTFGRVRPSIFFYDRYRRTWGEIFIDRDDVFRKRHVPADITALLDATVSRGIHRSAPLFFGKSDRVSLMVFLPLHKARYRYVVSIDMKRDGITAHIKKNIHRFLVFGMLLLAISMLLGKLFAFRIAAPIRRLSLIARERAAGDSEREFALSRRDEIGVLSDSLDVMTRTIGEHLSEIERRMKTMETMNRIDKAVLSSISRGDLLDRVIGLLSSLFGNSTVAMALYNEERCGFELLSRYTGMAPGLFAERPFVQADHIDAASWERVKTVFSFSGGTSDVLVQGLFRHLAGMEIHTGINAPVLMEGRYLGALVLAKEERTGYSEQEIESLIMLADQVAIALQSVRTFEEKEQLLLGILLALTRSIDAKSRWTAGHSERVAHFSEQIALRMNLGADEVRAIGFSAILHDIGKIAVSEFILDKPERLTEEEFALIREHPETGARIIADIPSYEQIRPGILHHHEHWDGSGYPAGLSGAAIPLTSRIISVADVWDAISADRPYRKGLGRNEATDFMRRHRAVLFDPEIVDVFLAALREG